MELDSHHIIFDKNFKSKISKSQYEPHQTWDLKADNAKEYILGGKVRNSDLNNLVSFDKIPEFLDIKSLNNIDFGIDFELFFNSLIDDKILSYKHKENSIPELITKNIKINNSYSNFPLEKTKIKLAKTPNDFKNQEWEGNCNKVGGKPIWIQEPEKLICPSCGNKMSFIFQLDSGLPDKNSQNDFEIMFGNDGICYAFWSDTDQISSYIWQSS